MEGRQCYPAKRLENMVYIFNSWRKEMKTEYLLHLWLMLIMMASPAFLVWDSYFITHVQTRKMIIMLSIS